MSLAQTFSQVAQYLSTLSAAGTSISPYTNRNRLVNPTMSIDQANEKVAVTLGQATLTYVADQWKAYFVQSGFAGTTTAQTITDAPTALQGGSSIAFTMGTGHAISAGDLGMFLQNIEAFNVTDFAFGTASASPVSLSFWVKTSLTGATFSAVLGNAAGNRSYVTNFTVPTAATWTKITIPNIPGDTGGTWLAETNGIGMQVIICFGAGSNWQGTAGSWQAAGVRATSSNTNLMATTGATFQVTGLQLEPGTVCTPLERRPFAQELAICQRYYEKSYDIGTAVGTATLFGAIQTIYNFPSSSAYLVTMPGHFSAIKRADPTMTYYSTGTGTVAKIRDNTNSTDVTATPGLSGMSCFNCYGACSAGTTSPNMTVHWVADARL